MLTDHTLKIAREFFLQFQGPLYDTGWHEPVSRCGAHQTANTAAATFAWSFLMGYAEACKLACDYRCREWEIAELVGTLAGIMLSFTESEDTPNLPRFRKACEQWTRELADLAKRAA